MDFETRLAMEWENEIQKYRLACQHLLKEFTFALNAWVKTALEQMPANWRASWDAFVQAWSDEGVELKDHWKRDFTTWLEYYEREAKKAQARQAIVKSLVAKGERDLHGPIPGPYDYGNSFLLSEEELLAESAWIRRVGPFAGLLRHLRSSRERKYVTIEERHRLHSSGLRIIEREQARLVLTSGETKELDEYLTDLMFTLDSPNWPPTVPESWSKKDQLAWRENEESKTRPSISAIAPGWDAKTADRQNKLRHPESTPYVEYERLLDEERLDEQARYYRGWGFVAMTFDRFMNPAWEGLGNIDDMAMALAGVGPAYIPPGPRGPIFFGDNRPANVEAFWREATSSQPETGQRSVGARDDAIQGPNSPNSSRARPADPTYVLDESGLTVRAVGEITGSHPLRGKGYRPEPVGGRAVGDHRGHLIPEAGVDNPRLVNVRGNIISEASRSNLGPKKIIENYAIRLADNNPNSVVQMILEPQRARGQTRPFAVTVWVTKDGRMVQGVSILNR